MREPHGRYSSSAILQQNLRSMRQSASDSSSKHCSKDFTTWFMSLRFKQPNLSSFICNSVRFDSTHGFLSDVPFTSEIGLTFALSPMWHEASSLSFFWPSVPGRALQVMGLKGKKMLIKFHKRGHHNANSVKSFPVHTVIVKGDINSKTKMTLKGFENVWQHAHTHLQWAVL